MLSWYFLSFYRTRRPPDLCLCSQGQIVPNFDLVKMIRVCPYSLVYELVWTMGDEKTRPDADFALWVVIILHFL